MRGGVRSDAGLLEQLRRESAGERFDLACELAFLGGQLQQSAGDRAEREQAAAQLRVVSAACAGRLGTLVCEGAARGTDRVEGVGLAAGAPFPP